MGEETDLAPHALFPLAVVDDHALRRAAFSGWLAETLPAEVVAFGTADELLAAAGGEPAGWVRHGGSHSVVALSGRLLATFRAPAEPIWRLSDDLFPRHPGDDPAAWGADGVCCLAARPGSISGLVRAYPGR
jgi:hypothetical protein